MPDVEVREVGRKGEKVNRLRSKKLPVTNLLVKCIMWNPMGNTLYVSEEAKNIVIGKQANREWLVQRVIEIEMFLLDTKIWIIHLLIVLLSCVYKLFDLYPKQ